MTDKTQQSERLMMHHLRETNSVNDKCALANILNSDPNHKASYNEMVKTRAILPIPVIEIHKTSNYKLLIQFLNNGFTFNSKPEFSYYSIQVAAIIVVGFSFLFLDII